VTHGPFFSSTYLGNILAVSNLEAGPVARLYALWYEHNAPDDRWSARTGLMLADSQFLQSDTAADFINNRISWPTFLTGNLPASGPAYPLPAPGIRVRAKPRDDVAFQAAVFSGDPGGGDGSNLSAPLPTGTLSRRRLCYRRGELLDQSGQGCQRASRRLPRRGVVPHPLAVFRSALRRCGASRSQIHFPRAFRSGTPATVASMA
jgi:Carbohydrate-selective porin, OprB family